MTFGTGIVISGLMRDFDEVRIKYPKCSRGYGYKVGRVRRHPNLRCPTCWASFTVEIERAGASIVRQNSRA